MTKIDYYKAHLPVEDRIRMFERQLTSFKENQAKELQSLRNICAN
jgi:hypothetical protein